MGTKIVTGTDGVAAKDFACVDQLVGGGTVTSVSAGPGISITGTASVPVVNNTGVLSVSAGTGISVTGTAGAPVVNNTGVLSVTAGTNVTIGGTAGNPVINAQSGAAVSLFGRYNSATAGNITNDIKTLMPASADSGIDVGWQFARGTMTKAWLFLYVNAATVTAGTVNFDVAVQGGGGTATIISVPDSPFSPIFDSGEVALALGLGDRFAVQMRTGDTEAIAGPVDFSWSLYLY